MKKLLDNPLNVCYPIFKRWGNNKKRGKDMKIANKLLAIMGKAKPEPTIKEALAALREEPFCLSEDQVETMIKGAEEIQAISNMSNSDVAKILINDVKQLRAMGGDISTLVNA